MSRAAISAYTASEADLKSLLEEIPLDPTVSLFASYCRKEAHASIVFARKRPEGSAAGLLEFCRLNSISCHPFGSFQDVLKVFKCPKNA
jgi:hypothetical protein